MSSEERKCARGGGCISILLSHWTKATKPILSYQLSVVRLVCRQDNVSFLVSNF
jgi:hypothetical protein